MAFQIHSPDFMQCLLLVRSSMRAQDSHTKLCLQSLGNLLKEVKKRFSQEAKICFYSFGIIPGSKSLLLLGNRIRIKVNIATCPHTQVRDYFSVFFLFLTDLGPVSMGTTDFPISLKPSTHCIRRKNITVNRNELASEKPQYVRILRQSKSTGRVSTLQQSITKGSASCLESFFFIKSW